ncbi:hypothetical protein [Methanofollis ethanolicus]|uniref:hypothetical protein n=1 Tax=Methanofollis ethanolicus TaxID=488124 RepID=UPI00083718D4|nr:hypothetical protein [Methanofollis ethanolicus]
MTDENIRIGSPVDDLDIDSIDDLIDWLECAEEDCRQLSVKVIRMTDREYLRGRAEAFGLAAGFLRDVQYRHDVLARKAV